MATPITPGQGFLFFWDKWPGQRFQEVQLLTCRHSCFDHGTETRDDSPSWLQVYNIHIYIYIHPSSDSDDDDEHMICHDLSMFVGQGDCL